MRFGIQWTGELVEGEAPTASDGHVYCESYTEGGRIVCYEHSATLEEAQARADGLNEDAVRHGWSGRYVAAPLPDDVTPAPFDEPEPEPAPAFDKQAAQHRAAWLSEACRHQQNAAYCATMAMHNRDTGNHVLAVQWQQGADASAYNARCNLFAAMNIKAEA
jgi:hypothetical protein